MGDFNSEVTYDQGNQYERQEVLNLDFELLNAHGIPSYLVRGDNFSYSKKHEQIAQKIIQTNSKKHSDWGFKEPRMCFTFPFWKRILESSNAPNKLIIVYRDPIELLVHYKVKTPKRLQQVISAWKDSNNSIIKHVKGLSNSDYHLIHYNDFIIEDSAIEKLSMFVGFKCVDLRNKKLYRSKSSNLPFYVNWIYKLFFKSKCDGIIDEINNLSR